MHPIHPAQPRVERVRQRELAALHAALLAESRPFFNGCFCKRGKGIAEGSAGVKKFEFRMAIKTAAIAHQRQRVRREIGRDEQAAVVFWKAPA